MTTLIHSSDRTPARMNRMLWLIPVMYWVFITAEFATMTDLTLRMTAAGRSALEVGLLATSMWIGVLLASSVTHRMVGLMHRAALMLMACALATSAIVSVWWHDVYAGWLLAAFALGFGGGMAWVAAEAWLAEAAPADRRGFYVGIFESSVGLGLMLGPLMVPLAHWLDIPVAWIACSLMATTVLLCAALLRVPMPGSAAHEEPGSRGLAQWIKIAPLAALALLGGLMESGIASLLPSISMRTGFSLESAALLGTVIGAGSALLQPPAGQLSDRFGTRRIMLIAWVMVLATNLALLAWAGSATWVLWLVGFTLGGVGGAVYTLIVIELGHRFTGSALVASMGLLVTSYSVGTAIGPSAGGWLFDVQGLAGLAVALVALSVVGYVMTVAWIEKQHSWHQSEAQV